MKMSALRDDKEGGDANVFDERKKELGSSPDGRCPRARLDSLTSHFIHNEITPASSHIQDIKKGPKKGFLESELMMDRYGIISIVGVQQLEKYLHYETKWWESNDLVVVIWGQLNTTLRVVDAFFYEFAMHTLLGDILYESIKNASTEIKIMVFREKFGESHNLDDIIRKD
jgi:hypothetical protein